MQKKKKKSSNERKLNIQQFKIIFFTLKNMYVCVCAHVQMCVCVYIYLSIYLSIYLFLSLNNSWL